MCANYTPPRKTRLAAQTGITASSDWKPETFPGYEAPILRLEDVNPHGEASGRLRELNLASFGMLAPWASDLKAGRSTYNARTETVAQKPSFRNAWKKRQFCVVPMENFFEPRYEAGAKPVRWKMEHADGIPLAAAGMWEWRPHGGPEGVGLFSFTILTINADNHPVLKEFHALNDEKRTIVLLEPHEIDGWLHATHDEAPSIFKTLEPDAFKVSAAPLPARARRRSTPMDEEPSLF